jgi:glycosyltransferase involved in cell wall biosynthesis
MDISNTSLSIVMPVFNTGDFILEALASIEANRIAGLQIEIILVDDRSTDPRTLEILQQAQQQPGTRLLVQSQNGGPSKARNAGLKVATGEWIGFLDADDMLLPGSLAHRFAIAQQHPEAEWIAGDYLEMPIRDQMVHRAHHTSFNAAGAGLASGVRRIDDAVKAVAEGYPIFFGAMLIRKRLLARAGGIRDELRYAEDWHYSMVLASCAPLYWTEVPLICLRRHHESLTKDTSRAAMENYKSELAIYRDKKFAAVRHIVRWRLAGVLRYWAEQLLNAGKARGALMLSVRAVITTPTDGRCWKLLWRGMRS